MCICIVVIICMWRKTRKVVKSTRMVFSQGSLNFNVKSGFIYTKASTKALIQSRVYIHLLCYTYYICIFFPNKSLFSSSSYSFFFIFPIALFPLYVHAWITRQTRNINWSKNLIFCIHMFFINKNYFFFSSDSLLSLLYTIEYSNIFSLCFHVSCRDLSKNYFFFQHPVSWWYSNKLANLNN